MQQHSTTEHSSSDLSGFLAELVVHSLEVVLTDSQAESIPESVKPVDSDVKVLIMSCSESVKVMARKFARNSSLDVDDLYSVAMLAVCETALRAASADDPIAYLCKAAKYAMIGEYRRLQNQSIVSLDAPLSSSSDVCLADLIPAPAPDSSLSDSKRSQALNDALDRLSSARQQTVLRRRYGFCGAETLRETVASLNTTRGAINSAVHCGLSNLRRDVELCKALGMKITRESLLCLR